MDYRYHIQHSEETYQHFFRVRRYQVAYESFRGGMLENIERECLGGTHHVVAALPYDPEREELILVEQFRIGAMVAGANPWQYEIVAGFMDADDPSPEASIQRELEEEIGTRARRLEPRPRRVSGVGAYSRDRASHGLSLRQGASESPRQRPCDGSEPSAP